MKKKVRKKILVLMGIIVILCDTISLSKYSNRKKYEISSQIARPIIILDADKAINKEVCKNDFPIEYNFSVKNYDDTGISEINFCYVISIQLDNSNFPVSYKLINVENENEIDLNNGESEKKYLLCNKKQIDNYKIIFEWKDQSIEMSEKLNIKLKIDAEEEC